MHDLLAEQRFPGAVLDSWKNQGITELLPIQIAALQSKVLDGKSCLVVGPTSSGKTFVGEMACVKHALSNLSCLYLVPFKALAEEKYADFQRRYAGARIGAQVIISTADRREHDKRLGDGDFNIAILTYEKLS